MAARIDFINADLEITSDRPLEPLRDNFMRWGDLFAEMCCEQIGDRYFARFEIHPEGIDEPSAAQLIHAYCEAIPRLDAEALALWHGAEKRVIDLGYQGADHCPAFHDSLPHPTLLKLSELEIDLALTFYPETIENA